MVNISITVVSIIVVLAIALILVLIKLRNKSYEVDLTNITDDMPLDALTMIDTVSIDKKQVDDSESEIIVTKDYFTTIHCNNFTQKIISILDTCQIKYNDNFNKVSSN